MQCLGALYWVTWLRVLRRWTAQTDVMTSVSTTGVLWAMAGERRETGGGTPGGGSRNCSDTASATSVCRSAYSTKLSSPSTAEYMPAGNQSHGNLS